MMPEIGEPYVQARGAEEMGHPPHPSHAVFGVQPEAMIREGAVDEQHGGAAVSIGAHAMQRQLHAVGREDEARRHS